MAFHINHQSVSLKRYETAAFTIGAIEFFIDYARYLVAVYTSNIITIITKGFTLMTEKTVSKYLLNLEKNVALDNPVLLQATKLFHQLDQLEFDLGLIENEETTASKNSWWPIVSLIGGNATAKAKFINGYLGSEQLLSGVQTSLNKFTLLLHSNQANPSTLPGTAADVDPRYPFYQISKKIEQQQAGEGSRVNAYLELKTIHSEHLKGKLFIDAPNMSGASSNPIVTLLAKHSIETADLVLVFVDVFESPSEQLNELIELIKTQQDSNKFVYLIDIASNDLYATNSHELIATWQRRLVDLGLHTGQFIAIANNNFSEVEQRMINVNHDRSYRVLNSLDKSINDISEVIIPEVRQSIAVWKERANMTSLILLGFFACFLVFAEVTIGVLEFLIDPIIGPIILVLLLAVMIPLHIFSSKLHAKLIINQLNKRQKELHLLENLSNLFIKGQSFWRILLPIAEPLDWNKKTKAKLSALTEQNQQLVQNLNDSFSSYGTQSTKREYTDLNL
jgi:hypothetical protein